MNNGGEPNSELVAASKRVAYFVLRAGLFWNNQAAGVHSYVNENGLFYHHSSMSAGEKFFEFLRSIGVLLREKGGHRLAVRPDAIEGYAAYLIDQGRSIDDFIDAIVCVGGESWLQIERTPFQPKFYENSDGTTSYDCRQFMVDMVIFGYARREGEYYQWTERMSRF